MPSRTVFHFSDTGSVADNVAAFITHMKLGDAALGAVLESRIVPLPHAPLATGDILNAMVAALNAPPAQAAAIPVAPAAAPTPPGPVAAAPIGWLLQELEVEGFRGINNEGSPLVLKLKTDAVNSISAPNGVGKSSIYDALTYALKRCIPKLDRLQAAERASEYYVNRFHPSATGRIRLTLVPEGGGADVVITITHSAATGRVVTGPPGIDAEALLETLDRDFVLLDGPTFLTFIDAPALERGRGFAGLLGLERYSWLRQELQRLSNTRSFNGHFDVTGHAATKKAADRDVATAKAAIAKAYQELIKTPLDATLSASDSQAQCHAALNGIPLLAGICAGKAFGEIDIEACLAAVQTAEGGPLRSRLAELIRLQEQWSKAKEVGPSDADAGILLSGAKEREAALATTAGPLLQTLYRASDAVLRSEGWSSPTLCPTCERDDGSSVLDHVEARLAQYEAVAAATAAQAAEWKAKSWSALTVLEDLVVRAASPKRVHESATAGAAGQLSTGQVADLGVYITELRAAAQEMLGRLKAKQDTIEKELPPSLVAVTTAIEAARRLQTAWNELAAALAIAQSVQDRLTRVTRIKTFVDTASNVFAEAETHIGVARLAQVEPLAQDFFKSIMFSPVVPKLARPAGREDLDIGLSEFWSLRNVSATALLSESYRNAFAISVYLAAASLYGGGARFVVLDDVTSSFDAGHQHHLMELIRTRFARPIVPNGLQLILLSHDTLLEKLFNRHGASPDWLHQRLEGNSRTAVLPQAGIVNKVRDTTLALLNQGRIEEAAPRIRQYLEFILHRIIDRCRIPVPMDLAFGDDKRTPGEYMNAIDAYVKLLIAANTLVLTPAQQTNMTVHSASIVGNFLSHWSSGQTQAFSAPALLGVMQAIEELQECFGTRPAPTGDVRFYRSLSR
ncbi:AAA family ATPase [Roseococcus sp.]|uniref:ATP-binding protein n=1 Tax=Roseococcus sp. TaxID=2109646 RepID=UPI003BAC8EDB